MTVKVRSFRDKWTRCARRTDILFVENNFLDTVGGELISVVKSVRDGNFCKMPHPIIITIGYARENSVSNI
jgi:hypothetical protein